MNSLAGNLKKIRKKKTTYPIQFTDEPRKDCSSFSLISKSGVTPEKQRTKSYPESRKKRLHSWKKKKKKEKQKRKPKTKKKERFN